MKVAFVVLLLAAAVLTKHPHKSRAVSVHTDDGRDCIVSEDCEELCNLQCYNTVDGLCVEGSCFCEVEPILNSRLRLLKKTKVH